MVEASSKSDRMPYFDNLKGILIILVVVGHFLNGAAASEILPAWHIFDFIYMFHMPLFIFVSGVFCKSVFTPSTGFRAGVVLYYLVLCWLMYLALWAPQAALGIAKPLNLLTVDGSMPWYLMALAIYCALVPLFHALRPAFAICCAFCLAVLSGLVDVGDMLSASRVMVFLPFFLIGFYLHPKSVLRAIGKLGSRLALTRCCAAIVIAVIFLGFGCLSLPQMEFNQTIFTGNAPYSSAVAFISDPGSTPSSSMLACCAARICGFALAALMGVCIMVLTPRGEVPLLTRTGRHTLQVYILHAFISYAIAYLGTATLIYQAMPPAAADVVIVALGTAASVILGWPDFIQNWLDRLKGAMSAFAR